MSREKVFQGWDDYDKQKPTIIDSYFFATDVPWEVDYLTNKIAAAYPQYSLEQIKAAIQQCGAEFPPPRPRQEFLSAVLSKLNA